jgi:Xaa-Pro aminopeptidase
MVGRAFTLTDVTAWTDIAPPAPAPPLDQLDRLGRARGAAAAAGLDALLLTPGADLRYLTGYDALPLERLTCLVLPSDGPAALVVPELELPRAGASTAAELAIDIVGWRETEDPYALVAALLRDGAPGSGPHAVGIADRMWAAQAMRLAQALPSARQRLASEVLRSLRMTKSAAEVAALVEAAAAIDRVHERIRGWRIAGRTEAAVARDVAEAILEEGHVAVNFVIVGSGPNGASPHHDVSARVIERGDVVVVDIGGTTAQGYCSDSTRTYALGDVPAGFADLYAVLREAQLVACATVSPGMPAAAIDAAARDLIAAAGYGELFVHRTGHGIGLEGHEEPWIVAGNDEPLAPGMTFSIEPGIYLPGRYGARIEDIVVCTEAGGERLNLLDRDLVSLEG